MYELHFRDTTETTAAAATTPFTVARIAETVSLAARLADRERLPPAELDAALAARSAAHSLACGGGSDRSRKEGGEALAFVPGFPVDRLFPGTYYLEGIGYDGSRMYGRRSRDAARVRGGALAPSLARRVAAAGVEGGEEAVARKGGGGEEDVTTTATVSGTEASSSGGDDVGEEEGEEEVEGRQALQVNGAPPSDSLIDRTTKAKEKVAAVAAASASAAGAVTVASVNGSIAAASATGGGKIAAGVAAGAAADGAAVGVAAGGGAQAVSVVAANAARLGLSLPRVVVTGVACGLPGQEKVFEEDNLARLLGGQGCVKRLSAGSMAALVEKNVVQVEVVVCLVFLLEGVVASVGVSHKNSYDNRASFLWVI